MAHLVVKEEGGQAPCSALPHTPLVALPGTRLQIPVGGRMVGGGLSRSPSLFGLNLKRVSRHVKVYWPPLAFCIVRGKPPEGGAYVKYLSAVNI